MDDSLCLLVLADVHYVGLAKHKSVHPHRRTELGLELVRRACSQVHRLQIRPDAVVLLGDLVDDGDAAGALDDLKALHGEVSRMAIPMIALPGNHDGSREQFESVFGRVEDVYDMNGVLLFPFADTYDAEDRATRSGEALQTLCHVAGRTPGRPIVVLQHNPIHPVIESDYPYMPVNRDAIMCAYRDAGALLSLSAHYHAGQQATAVDGVTYATCPGLCEAPFMFTIVQVDGRDARVVHHSIALGPGGGASAEPAVRVEDFHCHTQLAYCASDISVDEALARAREFGVGRQNFTEHSGQLYMARSDFWAAKFLSDPDIWLGDRASATQRMTSFRDMIRQYRSAYVGFGLETDCDGAGRLMVAEEDLEALDVLVGAVHFLPDCASENPSPAVVKREFMKFTESLVSGGVNILAHPFRVFHRHGLAEPEELYAPVAELLLAHGCAAELNMHGYEPEPEFYTVCMERGVKISLGSDSHALWEVGGFQGHLALLRRAGAPSDLSPILLTGSPRRPSR